MNILGNLVKSMEAELARYSTQIKGFYFKTNISTVKKSLESLRKTWKKLEKSLFCSIQRILNQYINMNMKRTAYHGGDLNRVLIIWLMNDAALTLIMNKIFGFLSTHKSPGTTDTAIRTLYDDVDNVELALKPWNKAFIMLNKKDPATLCCDEMQVTIDLAIEQMHSLKLSITPKCHAISALVVS